MTLDDETREALGFSEQWPLICFWRAWQVRRKQTPKAKMTAEERKAANRGWQAAYLNRMSVEERRAFWREKAEKRRMKAGMAPRVYAEPVPPKPKQPPMSLAERIRRCRERKGAEATRAAWLKAQHKHRGKS